MAPLLDWTNANINTSGDGSHTVGTGADAVNITVTGQGTLSSGFYGAGDYYRPQAGGTNDDVTEIQFSSAVENLTFELFDIDQGSWDDLVTIEALDSLGNPVPVTFSDLSHHTVVGNTVEGEAGLDTGGTGSQDAVTVTIPSSIVSLKITFSAGPDGSFKGGAGYGDITFDVSGPTCFTAGMEIATDAGPVAVEDLKQGDMLWTKDNGFQPVGFIYRKRVKAVGLMRPIVFEKMSIGNDKPLVVSQRHRMYVASLPLGIRKHFGIHQDTLVQAHELVNGKDIRIADEYDEIEYFHLMFDDHQLLHCHGTVSESWQPTKSALKSNPDVAAELLEIFPEIAERRSYSPGALARFEVQIKGTKGQEERRAG